MWLPAVEQLRLFTLFAKPTPEQCKNILEHLKIAERMHESMPEKYWRAEPEPQATPETEATHWRFDSRHCFPAKRRYH